MTGKCHHWRVCRRKDEEYDRKVEENRSQDDDVVKIGTDKFYDPIRGRYLIRVGKS